MGIWATAPQIHDHFMRDTFPLALHLPSIHCSNQVCYTHINIGALYMANILPISTGTVTFAADVIRCFQKQRHLLSLLFLILFFFLMTGFIPYFSCMSILPELSERKKTKQKTHNKQTNKNTCNHLFLFITLHWNVQTFQNFSNTSVLFTLSGHPSPRINLFHKDRKTAHNSETLLCCCSDFDPK